MLGLLPATLQVLPVSRRRRVPDEVVEELQRLKGLYDGFGYRNWPVFSFIPAPAGSATIASKSSGISCPPPPLCSCLYSTITPIPRGLRPAGGDDALCARLEQAQYQPVFARLSAHDHRVDDTF